MIGPDKINRVSIIGAGNLATHIARALTNHDVKINCVYNRTKAKADELASLVGARSVFSPSEFDNSDLIIICVNDDAITGCAAMIFDKSIPVVHTSGSVGIERLAGHENSGVFYPVQSFQKQLDLNWTAIPICIEANSKSLENRLVELGMELSQIVHVIPGEERALVHLSAVLVSNFTNLLYIEAGQLLKSKNLDFSILLPLISETASRLSNDSPSNLQTGPAIRNDQTIINKHLEMLNEFPQLKELYKICTERILKLNSANTYNQISISQKP